MAMNWTARLLGGTALSAAVLVQAAWAQSPNARPQGGVVVAGSAGIAQSPSQTVINQTTGRAAIDWTSFDVGSAHSVTFHQPSAQSITLNRVTGADPSVIAGRVNANGQLVLINQSGVIFTPGAQVNTAGLIVSSANVSNRDFMAGRLVFNQPGKPGATIVNQGTLTVGESGLAALVAPGVANSGVIRAKLGHVVLAAGATHQALDLYGDGLLSVDVTSQVTEVPIGPDGRRVTALVTNTGTILAPGGVVELTARAADGVVQNLISVGGKVSADSVGGRTGRIVMSGVGGALIVDGTVEAAGRDAGTQGGRIELRAQSDVRLTGAARVDASGVAGGGIVAVGTTLARAIDGPALAAPMAQQVIVARGARITADATVRGQGGRVTLLADKRVTHAGLITARGGRAGGNGGQVEISAGQLVIPGHVSVTAPRGTAGSILLDPGDVVIKTGGASAPAGGDFTAATTIDPGSFAGAVTIRATGSVDILSAILAGKKPDLTGLSIFAVGAIAVGADVTVHGAITLAAGQSLTIDGTTFTPTGAANLTFGAGVTVTAGKPGTPAALDLRANGSILQASTGSLVAGTLTASAGGNVVLLAKAAGQFSNGVGQLGAVTAGGDVRIGNGQALTVTGAVTVGAGSVLQLAAPSVTLSATGKLTAPAREVTAGGVTTVTPGRVEIQADAVSLGNGSISALDGLVAIAPLTAGLDLSVDATRVAGHLSLTLADLAAIQTVGATGAAGAGLAGVQTIALGSTDGTAGTVTAGSISLNAAVDLTGRASTLSLAAGQIARSGAGTSTGAISQTAAGAITVGTLTGQAGGSVNLAATNPAGAFVNHVGFIGSTAGSTAHSTGTAIGDFTAGGDGRFGDAAAISIRNAVSAGDGHTLFVGAPQVTLLSTGSLTANARTTVAGGVTTVTPGRVEIQADAVSLGDGSISALDGLVAIAPLTAGLDLSVDATRVAGHLSLTLADLAAIQTVGASGAAGAGLAGVQTIALGSTDGTAGTVTAGSISLNAAVDLTGRASTLSLAAGQIARSGGGTSTGAISQTAAGAITVGTLTGQAGGSVSLAATNPAGAFVNHVGFIGSTAGSTAHSTGTAIGDFTAGGDWRFGDAAAISIRGAVSAGDGHTLFVGAPQVTLLSTGSLTANARTTVAGGVTTVTPGRVEIQADAVSLGDGSISALDGLVAIAPLTAGLDLSVDATRVAGHLSLTLADLATIDTWGSAGLHDAGSGLNGVQDVVLGSVDGTQAGTTAGTVSINTGIDLTAAANDGSAHRATTLLLASTGTISQAAGAGISVATLGGQAGGAITLNATDGSGAFVNRISFIGSKANSGTLASTAHGLVDGLIAGGDIAFGDLPVRGSSLIPSGPGGPTAVGDLTIRGLVSAQGAVSITAQAIDPTTLARLIVTGSIISQGISAGPIDTPAQVTLQAGGGTGPDSAGSIRIEAGGSVEARDAAGNLLPSSVVIKAGTNADDAPGAGLLSATDLSSIQIDGTVRATRTAGAGTQPSGIVRLFSAGVIAEGVATTGNADGSLSPVTVASGSASLDGAGAIVAGILTGFAGRWALLPGASSPLSPGVFTNPSGDVSNAGLTNHVLQLASFDVNLAQPTAPAFGLWLRSGGDMLVQADSPLRATVIDHGGAGVRLEVAAPTGNPNLVGAATLTLQGSVISRDVLGAGNIFLGASGDIVQAGGSLDAAILSGSAGAAANGASPGIAGSATLTGATNRIDTLGNVRVTQDFRLNDAVSLAVAGAVEAGTGSTALSTPTAVSVVAITGPRLDIVPGGTISAGRAAGGGTISLLATGGAGVTAPLLVEGGITATQGSLGGGGITLQAQTAGGRVGDISLPGTVRTVSLPGHAPLDSVTLLAAGAIDEGAGNTGSITTALLTGSAGTAGQPPSGAVLGGANQIANMGDFTTRAGLSLTNTSALTVTGTVHAGLAPDADYAGTPPATTLLSITAASLAVADTGAVIAGIGGGPGGDVSLTTTTGAMNLGGAITAVATGTAVTPRGGTVTLVAHTDLAQTGVLNAATLTGSAGGNARIDGASAGANQIGVLGNFTAPGTLSLRDSINLTVAGAIGTNVISLASTQSVTVTGSVSGSAVSIGAGGALSLPGSVAGNTVALSAGAAGITETGHISAGLLSGASGGTTDLIGANAIDALGAFTSAGAFTLIDGTSLVVSGTLQAPKVQLNVTGAIGETGAILAGVLTGTSTAGANFAGATATANQIATLGDFTSGGAFVLDDGIDLSVAGHLVAPTVRLVGAGSIAEPGRIDTSTLSGSSVGTASFAGTGPGINRIASLGDFTAGGAMSLDDGEDLAIAGTVTAPSLRLIVAGAITEFGSLATGLLSGNTTGATTLTGANHVTAIGTFASGAAFSLADLADLDVAGSLSAQGAITLQSPNLAVTGAIATPSSLDLIVAGNAVEPGSIRAGLLTGAFGGAANLEGASLGANAIGVIGDLIAGSSLAVGDGLDIVVAGLIQAPSVRLDSAAGIRETGRIVASALSGSSAGATSLGAPANQIDTITGFASGGGFSLADARALTVAGLLSAGGDVTLQTPGLAIPGAITTPGGLTLAVSGNVTETGVLQLGSIQGSVGGVALLDGATPVTNRIGQLTNFAAGQVISLRDGAPLVVTGTIRAPDIRLTGPQTSGPDTPGILVSGDVTFVTSGNPYTNPGSGVAPVPPAPGRGLEISFTGSAGYFMQQGSMTVASIDGRPPVISFILPGAGAISLDPTAGLQSPSGTLFLQLGTGTAGGRINVGNLGVLYTTVAGQAVQLVGSVGGITGTAAAGKGSIGQQIGDAARFRPDSQYRLNGCPISAVNCVILPFAAVPALRRTDDFTIDTSGDAAADPELLPPDISARDY